MSRQERKTSAHLQFPGQTYLQLIPAPLVANADGV